MRDAGTVRKATLTKIIKSFMLNVTMNKIEAAKQLDEMRKRYFPFGTEEYEALTIVFNVLYEDA